LPQLIDQNNTLVHLKRK